MRAVKTYVEFYYADGSIATKLVNTRDVKRIKIPEGVVKYRFYDTSISVPMGIASVYFVGVESNPFNYSEFFIAE